MGEKNMFCWQGAPLPCRYAYLDGTWPGEFHLTLVSVLRTELRLPLTNYQLLFLFVCTDSQHEEGINLFTLQLQPIPDYSMHFETDSYNTRR